MGCGVVFSKPQSALENMNRDASLLESLGERTTPLLHFYEWESEAATFGHFIEPEKVFNFTSVKNKGLDLARRPTGGGVVFHNCDLAFSFLLPATHPAFSLRPLDNYSFVNQKVGIAIGRFLGKNIELLQEESFSSPPLMGRFCMAKPTKYDVMIGGKKVGGAAQRIKTQLGYLHQGSIYLGLLPEEYLTEILLSGNLIYQEMKRNSFPLLGDQWNNNDLSAAREALQRYIQETFEG